MAPTAPLTTYFNQPGRKKFPWEKEALSLDDTRKIAKYQSDLSTMAPGMKKLNPKSGKRLNERVKEAGWPKSRNVVRAHDPIAAMFRAASEKKKDKEPPKKRKTIAGGY
jgi:hypothetical protein